MKRNPAELEKNAKPESRPEELSSEMKQAIEASLLESEDEDQSTIVKVNSGATSAQKVPKLAPKAIAKKPKSFYTQLAKERNIFKKRDFLVQEIE